MWKRYTPGRSASEEYTAMCRDKSSPGLVGLADRHKPGGKIFPPEWDRAKKVESEDMTEGKIVLCGANSYEKKYYFNQEFNKIPESIQKELHIICVLFTEEVGGIVTFAFETDGTLVIETDASEEDYYYDEIGSGLLVKEIRRNRQELLESLSLYYRVVFLGESVER